MNGNMSFVGTSNITEIQNPVSIRGSNYVKSYINFSKLRGNDQRNSNTSNRSGISTTTYRGLSMNFPKENHNVLLERTPKSNVGSRFENNLHNVLSGENGTTSTNSKVPIKIKG